MVFLKDKYWAIIIALIRYDLPLVQSNTMAFTFADDSTLLASSSSISEFNDNLNDNLNDNIKLVSNWVNGNLMTLNCKKPKGM